MARPAFSNVHERFLPSPAQRPDLVFGAPWIQYVNNRQTLNAGADILDATVARVGRDRRAIIDADREEDWTYGRLQDEVNRLGHALLKGSFRPGDRVLLRLPDLPEAAVAQLAVWKVGGIAVPSSVLERARELEFMLNDTEASVAIVHADHLVELEKVRAACPYLKDVIAVPESDGDYTSYRRLQSAPPVDLRAHPNLPLDAASIFYTGGTTGHPKGCLHTHAAEVVLADLNIMARDAGPDDVFFSHAPIGHAAGNGEKINFPFRAGSSAIYAIRPSPRRVWELAERHRASIFLGAATMFRMMLRDAPEPRREFPELALRFALSSAEVLDERTFQTWSDQLGFEMCNVVGMVPFRHIFIHPAWMGQKVAPGRSVGQPLPGYDIRLVGEDGALVPPGGVGRVAARGPTGITYWTNLHPGIRERAKIDVIDGWSICDDAYHRDPEGFLWFESRLDDMIVTAGFQVAAPEVELILKTHEAVADVAVVAAPDELRGQVVMAYVVLRDGFAGDPGMVHSLQEHAKREMAPYKYPRLIQFITELPKDDYGKIQRRRLRDQAASRSEALPGKNKPV
jgi:2-aminobenzoate-CoA ligase